MSRIKAEETPAAKEPVTKPTKQEKEKRREEEKLMRRRAEEPPFEPAAQRVSDLVPIEEGIDRDYPAQRIVISNFVRNGCHVKRWLYEDSYPIDGPRPAICDLMSSQQRRPYMKCCCGRRKVCDGLCGKDLFSKQKRFESEGLENERIRGELQRLDVILKNLDD
ncbi:hypothetical protein OESDEN_06930 [Oesophagostomum dentatum]|uniref:Uncharacterized protein n=1 Tax=Oesophagostomum dentatum TaxID=61180 RepID=A0A0B1TAN8_OESDE|nr:hypothetical protein OESDEN_06930 [Oesophagostomum dentatum]